MTESEWTGTRSAPSAGMVGNGRWDSFSISWNIALEAGVYHYQYTISGLSGKALSHVDFDLSDNCTPTSQCVFNASYDVAGTPQLFYGTFADNPGQPGFPAGASITGVKFDMMPAGVGTISFDSVRAPMWGDFYAKDGVAGGGTGVWNYAYNQGLAGHDTYNNAGYYVAVPDTVGSGVPEPGSWMLMASGGLMLALGLWRRAGRRS
ncbi:MAG: hypothetical protein ABFD86_01490 [Bryobacteraceae bacterium]